MRATEMNQNMFTSNGKIKWQNFGWIQFDFRPAADFHEKRLGEYKSS